MPPANPLQCRLFTPELQRQSRGQMEYLAGGACNNVPGRPCIYMGRPGVRWSISQGRPPCGPIRCSSSTAGARGWAMAAWGHCARLTTRDPTTPNNNPHMFCMVIIAGCCYTGLRNVSLSLRNVSFRLRNVSVMTGTRFTSRQSACEGLW